MRVSLNTIIMLLSTITINAQKTQLIAVKHYSDNVKDCRYTGNCITINPIKNDSLYLTIFFDNNGRDLDSYRDSFRFINDTLNLILIDTNRIVISTYFDSVYKRLDTIYTINVPVMRTIIGGHDFMRFHYVFTGYKEIPKAFRFNNYNLCECPTKPIKFELFKNDTINMINANGYKDGVWITFYETGEIKEKYRFDNGTYNGGTTYDKNGKDLKYLFYSEGGIDYNYIEIEK